MVRPIPEYFYSAGNNMNQLNHHIWYHESPHLLLTAIGLFLTITALVSLCAHHNTRSSSTKGSTTSKKQQREKQLKGDKDIYIMSTTTTTSTYTNSSYETGLEQKKGNHNNTPAVKEVAPVSSMDNSEEREPPPPPPRELTLVVPPRSPLRSVLTSPLRSPLMRSPKRFFTAINDKAISPLFRGKKRGGCGGGGEIYDHDGFTSDEEELYEEEEGVWQKNILLGDKCRPLEFSGVIYYDSSGKRVDDIPRSPHRATPPSSPHHRGFSFPVAGELM